MRILLFCLLLLGTLYQSPAQIVLHNPSFEIGPPRTNIDPPGWINCVFEGETGGDIHGKNTGFFAVAEKAQDGDNFLGLVTRANNTWETVGVKLPEELRGGYSYAIQFYANKSETYLSKTNVDDKEAVRYSHPSIVQIYGGAKDCEMGELLAQTSAINGGGWELQKLILFPTKDYSHLYINAYYPEEGKYTQGNVLLDAFAPIELFHDTSRYQFLCLNGELVTYFEKVALDAQGLREVALNYNKKVLSASNPDIDLSPEEYNISLVDQLQKKLAKYGVYEYFFKEKMRVKRREIAVLKEIAAVEEWEVLNRGLEIFVRNKMGEASEEDQTYFTNLQEHFAEVDDLENSLLEYVWKNKQTLLDGYGKCIW